MEKMNKKRQPRKELSTPILVILSLFYAAALVLFGICFGFLIDAIINSDIYDILANVFITLSVGIINLLIHIRLMCNSDSENVQPFKWYVNNIFIVFMICLVIAAITVGVLGSEHNSDMSILVGTLLFPLTGIIATPNVVRHVLSDTSKWKDVLYKHGNLHTIKNSKDYYKVEALIPFEKKLLFALYKEEFLNILVVVLIMAIVIIGGLHYMTTDHSFTDNFIQNILIMKARKAFGVVFFSLIFIFAFGIPIITYYACNTINRIRIIRNHKYIAYHAIVSSASNGVAIRDKGTHYEYKYAIYIGIKAKDIHQTPATLIFIPDYVIVVPDKEKYNLI